MSKRANPKCKFYHPGSGILQPVSEYAYGANRFDDARKAVSVPYIAIALEGRARQIQDASRRWQFGLVIPKAFVGFGQLKIETGFGPLKTLRLSTLMLGEEFVPINVDANYGIKWVSDEVDHDYKSAVQQDIDKISANDGYVFGGSGKIRIQTGILTWGENYVFVWRNPHFFIPDSVDHYFIARNEDWLAAVVTLPIDHNEAVEVWLRDQFGAAVTTNSRQWSVIYPPPLDRDADGNITVGTLRVLFLGFLNATDDDHSGEAISVSIQREIVAIRPGADQKTIASIVIPAELDNYPLTLTWGPRALQPILCERRQIIEQIVEFSFRTADGVIESGLHRAVTKAILLEVRAGNADILSVQIPQGISGTLYIREGTLGWTEIARFVGVATTNALSDEQISILTNWLRKQVVDFRLSFGSFGEFTACAQNKQPTQVTLSKSSRKHLEWHLRLVLQGPARYAIESLSDAEIIKAVSARNQGFGNVVRQNMLLSNLTIARGNGRER